MSSTFTVVKDPFITITNSLINNSNGCGRVLRSISVYVYFSDNTSASLLQTSATFSADTLTISGILNLLSGKTITSVSITATYTYYLGVCSSQNVTGSISNLSISLSPGVYLLNITVKLTPSGALVYL